MKRYSTLAFALLALSIAACGQTSIAQSEADSPTTTDAKDNVYSKVFEQIQATAKVGKDDAYTAATKYLPTRNSSVAPSDLRDLITTWKNAGQKRVSSEFHADAGQLSLTWHSSMSVIAKSDKGLKALDAKMKAYGLKAIEKPSLPHLTIRFDEYQRRQRPPRTSVFQRRTGDVLEQVVVDVQGGLVGGDFESVVNVDWSVSMPFVGPPPSLDQLASAIPQFQLRTTGPNDESLLAIVRHQPIYQTAIEAPRQQKARPSTGYSGLFSRDLCEQYEAELKRLGYRDKRTFERENFKQVMWHRFDDDAYANVITYKNQKTATLSYEAPRRHRREPMPLDQLTFKHATSKEVIRLTQEFGSKTATPKWLVDSLGGRNDGHFGAKWQTLGRDEQWTWSDPSHARRPLGRSIHAIRIYGTLDQTQKNRVHSVTLAAKRCPAEGWCCRFTLKTLPDGKLYGHFAFARYLADNERPISTFAVNSGAEYFSVTKQYGGTKYRMAVVNKYENLLRDVSKSPESMRDTITKKMDQLLAEFGRGIESGKAISSAELMEAKNARLRLPNGQSFVAIPPEPAPPREAMPSGRKLTAEEKKELNEQATKTVEIRKAYIKEHYRELHAALEQTFPIADLGSGSKSVC
jgi:hypothetical protein